MYVYISHENFPLCISYIKWLFHLLLRKHLYCLIAKQRLTNRYTYICIAFWLIVCHIFSDLKFYIKLCVIVWSVNLFRFIDHTFTGMNHLSYFAIEIKWIFFRNEIRRYQEKTKLWYNIFFFQKIFLLEY